MNVVVFLEFILSRHLVIKSCTKIAGVRTSEVTCDDPFNVAVCGDAVGQIFLTIRTLPLNGEEKGF